MSESTTTITGRLTAAPELSFATAPVVNFTVAVTERRRQGDGWVDGPTSFFKCVAWRELAEHIAESVDKGDRVIVTGRLRQRSWESDSGERRSRVEIEVDDLGPSLRWTNAEVIRPITSSSEAAA